MVTVAVAGLHVEVRGGAAAEFAGGLDGLDLRGGGALGVEVALAGDFAGGGDDDAAEVGVGGCEAGGFVGEVGSASDVGGVERVGGGGEGHFAFADNGRRVGSESETRQCHCQHSVVFLSFSFSFSS